VVDEIHAIVNPVAEGGRAGRRWPAVAARLGTIAHTVRCHVTSGPGEATQSARDVLHAVVREVLSIGGDGTTNEIVNGFFHDSDAMAPEAVLSIMPLGTGTLGVKRNEAGGNVRVEPRDVVA